MNEQPYEMATGTTARKVRYATLAAFLASAGTTYALGALGLDFPEEVRAEATAFLTVLLTGAFTAAATWLTGRKARPAPQDHIRPAT